jgi:hypothetical protein
VTKSKKGAAFKGPWVHTTRDLLMSPAWRALSLSARRVLNRLEIEMMSNGGAQSSNGCLIVTYTDFIEYGVRKDSLGSAIREAVALGLVAITEPGRGGNAAFRKATKYRLTYHRFKIAQDSTTTFEPTNEWRQLKTTAEARGAVEAAEREANSKQNTAPRNGGAPPPKRGAKTSTFRPSKRGVGPAPRNEGYL